ncbi:Ribonuclease H protein [Melia azedarach]|uniref:Ribonuclease H protein n=1 Tax=Melia azedarach TaxID=155640 RepID=A0ACC1XPP0_MELAZ|nr:Ribonuclease H protein [Melia azedarach]
MNSRNIENKAGAVDGGVINPVKKDNVGLQGVSGAAFGASSPPPQRSTEHFKLASQNHHQKPTRDLAYDPSAAFTPLSVKDNRRELKIKAEGNDDQNPHRTWKKDLEVEAKRKMNTSVCWKPPPKNWVKLNIEGCSSGVQGSAGAGGIIRDESGKWLLGYSKNLGTSNRLASELWALYHGLDLVLERGFRKVLVESVSHEAMKCLQQPTAYLDANRDLIQSCRDLLHL